MCLCSMQHTTSSSSVNVVEESRGERYPHRTPDEGRNEGVLCKERKGRGEEREVCALFRGSCKMIAQRRPMSSPHFSHPHSNLSNPHFNLSHPRSNPSTLDPSPLILDSTPPTLTPTHPSLPSPNPPLHPLLLWLPLVVPHSPALLP